MHFYQLMTQAQDGDHDFAKVTGDVSLDYALETIIRGAPTFAADAEVLLTQLRRRP